MSQVVLKEKNEEKNMNKERRKHTNYWEKKTLELLGIQWKWIFNQRNQNFLFYQTSNHLLLSHPQIFIKCQQWYDTLYVFLLFPNCYLYYNT